MSIDMVMNKKNTHKNNQITCFPCFASLEKAYCYGTFNVKKNKTFSVLKPLKKLPYFGTDPGGGRMLTKYLLRVVNAVRS